MSFAAVRSFVTQSERAATAVADGMQEFRVALTAHDRAAQESARLTVLANMENYLDSLMSADLEATRGKQH